MLYCRKIIGYTLWIPGLPRAARPRPSRYTESPSHSSPNVVYLPSPSCTIMFLRRSARLLGLVQTRTFSSSSKTRTVRLSDRSKFPFLTRSARVVEDSGLFSIHLDDRVLLTPLGSVLRTPSEALAHLIRAEFEAQANRLCCFSDLPYALLLSKALDLTPERRADHLRRLRDAINTDSVLFFDRVKLGPDASAIPDLDVLSDEKLKALGKFDLDVVQSFFFSPVLDAFSAFFGVPPLATSPRVSEIPAQDPAVLAALGAFLDSLAAGPLVAVVDSHQELRSIVLAALLLNGLVSPARALRLSRLEETVQSSHWGVTDSFEREERRVLAALERALAFFRVAGPQSA